MCDHKRMEMTYISERDVPGGMVLDVRCTDCGACGSSILRAADFGWDDPSSGEEEAEDDTTTG